MVDDLRKGWITPEEAHLAQYVSVAEDVIVESDSGDTPIIKPFLHCSRVLCTSATRSFESINSPPDSLGRCGGLVIRRAWLQHLRWESICAGTGSANQGCVESERCFW